MRILFLGVLRESKGVKVLVEAFRELVDERGVPCSLDLAGEFSSEEFEAEIRSLVREGEFEAHVSFRGYIEGADRHSILCGCDVVVLPSFFDSENLPLSIIEAMSYGKPVVATRWRAIPELVEDGVTGFLTEPASAPSLVDALERIGRDPDLRERLGRAGRDRYLARYTLDAFRSNIEEVLAASTS